MRAEPLFARVRGAGVSVVTVLGVEPDADAFVARVVLGAGVVVVTGPLQGLAEAGPLHARGGLTGGALVTVPTGALPRDPGDAALDPDAEQRAEGRAGARVALVPRVALSAGASAVVVAAGPVAAGGDTEVREGLRGGVRGGRGVVGGLPIRRRVLSGLILPGDGVFPTCPAAIVTGREQQRQSEADHPAQGQHGGHGSWTHGTLPLVRVPMVPTRAGRRNGAAGTAHARFVFTAGVRYSSGEPRDGGQDP